jgi:mannose-6-phosphate isomerase-like protein (cupin superfamily)
LRVYDLNVALTEGDKTRVFRSSNLMINILRERQEPRDVSTLSPHAHADFEQASVTLSGVHLHHLRTPWTPDMRTWRADETVVVGAPSVTVIPPGLIHTTRNVGPGPALLVDLFAPPRSDFARRPGMVRNADEYPLPPELNA